MLTHVRTRLVPALAVLSFLACAKGEEGTADSATASAAGNPPAATQASSGAITADEIRSYRLTMDKVRAFHTAQVAWSKDSAAVAEAKSHENDEDEPSTSAEPSAAESATQLMRTLEKRPATLAAVRKSGFTPREAATLTMVLTYASLAVVSNSPSTEVSAENVAFVRTNRAEIERMQKDAEAAASKD